MNKPVIMADLDDTLFQTARKCPNNSTDGLVMMSTLIDGTPSGFATPIQQNFLAWLRIGKVIPVTARSTEVLARVAIEQAPAVASNGGCILSANGQPDPAWHDHLKAQAADSGDVNQLYADLTADLDPSEFRHWVVSENDLPLYIVIKSNHSSAEALLELAATMEKTVGNQADGWRRHSNGNNLAILPRWLNKRHAVAYLIEKIRSEGRDTPIIGVGDSTSDAGFIDLCDYAIAPTNSQLWKSATAGNHWLA